jgi:hypothetical protein
MLTIRIKHNGEAYYGYQYNTSGSYGHNAIKYRRTEKKIRIRPSIAPLVMEYWILLCLRAMAFY